MTEHMTFNQQIQAPTEKMLVLRKPHRQNLMFSQDVRQLFTAHILGTYF